MVRPPPPDVGKVSWRPVTAVLNALRANREPQWTPDGRWCLRGVTNEIQFYDAADFSKGVVQRCVVKDLSYFKVAPRPDPCTLAVFVPSVKAAPASVRLYQGPEFKQPISNRSFFKADKISVEWNRQGTACLVSAATELDTSGKSYYGETNLYYLAVDGDSARVTLDKEGPIYSFDWAPNGREFAVVYGFMPAKATLFNQNCDTIFDFGTGPRSVVQHNSHGNILMIAGFGNLQGEVQFWSRKDLTLINQLNAADTTQFEWCPDGQHLVTATCSPRLKVENGIKLWHYARGEVFRHDIGELWSVAWQPAACPELPLERVAGQRGSKTANFVPPKKQAYRPPGLRGTDVKLPTLHPEDSKATEPQLTKSQLKNKRKREAAARAKELALAGGADAAATPAGGGAKPPAKGTAPAAAAPEAAPDPEKRIRSLNKKLRQIQVLKEKQAAGEALQENQLDKIAEEPTIAAEIAAITETLGK